MSSYLFVPGNNPGMLQTAEVFGAEGIIFDLEDAIASSDKDSALDLVKSFLLSHSLSNAFVRLNDLDKTGTMEVKELDELELQGYVLPKATTDTVRELKTKTRKRIIALIETPQGVLEAEQIAKETQVVGLLLGGEDLALELSAIRTKDDIELQYAKLKVILVAAANKIHSIDTPFTDLLDDLGLRESIEQSKSLGFSAKAAIHPNQVYVINEMFQPNQVEIDFAKKVLETAKVNAKGVFSVDGKMVDLPIILRAEKTLEKAKKYENLSKR